MRASGILMPVFSLPSKYGVGTFGCEAYNFIDFLVKSGQSYWQILPLGCTTFGDSPYQTVSSAAGNPYFIDLDLLCREGLLLPQEYENEDFGKDRDRVDYEKLYKNRLPVLRRACERFDFSDGGYIKFCKEQSAWLEPFALFMAVKDSFGGKSWNEWDEPFRKKDEKTLAEFKERYAADIAFYKFAQYEFYKQWNKLKAYANENGIKIIGDMPIYVSFDSSDVWWEPEQFDLDGELAPRVVSGCPPDAFSADGQLWGSPVYDWERMENEAVPYGWWRRRIRQALGVYDIIRIDHFRGFESFYCIPYGDKNAKRGKWRKGPGMKFFNAMNDEFGGELPIIAEDLGLLTPEVNKLLADTGFAGMKVLQFAFGSDTDNAYLPHNHIKNCVVYTGTHDNDTIIGWVKHASKQEVFYARRYLHIDDNEGFHWGMIRAALESVADTAILMMPDFMGLDSSARINAPSTLGGNNWQWRIGDGCINDWLASIIRENVALYGRLPKPADGVQK